MTRRLSELNEWKGDNLKDGLKVLFLGVSGLVVGGVLLVWLPVATAEGSGVGKAFSLAMGGILIVAMVVAAVRMYRKRG